jgi:hypothetical protein
MNDGSNAAGIGFGCVAAIMVLGYGVVQICAGYLGIQFHLGTGWAIFAAIAMLLFRFTLPITVGSFFCAKDIWDWHWSLALLFAAPGLAFMALMIPGVLAEFVKKARGEV